MEDRQLRWRKKEEERLGDAHEPGGASGSHDVPEDRGQEDRPGMATPPMDTDETNQDAQGSLPASDSSSEESDGMEESGKMDDGDMPVGILAREMRQSTMQAILSITKDLGGRPKDNERHLSKSYKVVLSEIYSPPRVTAAAEILKELDIDPGLALDLTTCDENGEPWDFGKDIMRAKAKRLVEEQKPMLLIGSPMCTMYSAWQRINKWRGLDAYKKR